MQPCSCILYSELVPPTCDVTCSKPKRDGENVSDKKLSVENILHITQDLSLSSIFFFLTGLFSWWIKRKCNVFFKLRRTKLIFGDCYARNVSFQIMGRRKEVL